jgi:hypothetical protein
MGDDSSQDRFRDQTPAQANFRQPREQLRGGSPFVRASAAPSSCVAGHLLRLNRSAAGQRDGGGSVAASGPSVVRRPCCYRGPGALRAERSCGGGGALLDRDADPAAGFWLCSVFRALPLAAPLQRSRANLVAEKARPVGPCGGSNDDRRACYRRGALSRGRTRTYVDAAGVRDIHAAFHTHRSTHAGPPHNAVQKAPSGEPVQGGPLRSRRRRDRLNRRTVPLLPFCDREVRPQAGRRGKGRRYGITIRPPVVGALTPVVPGKLIGNPRSVRAAK